MTKLYAFTLCIMMGALACTGNKDKNKKPAIPEVPVVQVVLRDTLIDQAYVTNIKAIRNTEVRSRVHGFLEKVLADEGRFVQAGQPLFQLSTGEQRIAIAKAKAVLASAVAAAKTADLEAERVSLLVEKKVITKTELELAKSKQAAAVATIQEARASLDEAELKMSYTTVRAPFAGTINNIPLRMGSLIEEGTLLTSISDVSSVFAYFRVSENEYLRFNKLADTGTSHSNQIKLVLSDGTAYEQPGLIETMQGEFDESTGAIAFRARFPNPGAILKHGATGKVVLTSSNLGALLIPQKAVFEIQDRYYVFVVDEKGRISQRAFEPLLRLGQLYLVKSGLKQGDIIVFEGIQNLRDGNTIRPKLVTAADALASK